MLTPQREKFVQGMLDGLCQADAYRAAYECRRMSDKTIWEKASRLAADDKVRARLEELRAQVDQRSIMSAQKRLEWLTGLIESDHEPTKNKLRAIDIMNRMQGEYVTKVEGNMNLVKLEDLL